MSTALPSLLQTLRSALDAIALPSPSLPAARAWANAAYTPRAGTPFLSDTLDVADTRPASLGLGSLLRTEALYTVRVHVPVGSSAVPALRWAGAIAGAFLRASLTVEGAPLDVTEARVEGAFQSDDAWYVVPVSVFVQFDHST
jgi:hypothetical protein